MKSAQVCHPECLSAEVFGGLFNTSPETTTVEETMIPATAKMQAKPTILIDASQCRID